MAFCAGAAADASGGESSPPICMPLLTLYDRLLTRCLTGINPKIRYRRVLKTRLKTASWCADVLTVAQRTVIPRRLLPLISVRQQLGIGLMS